MALKKKLKMYLSGKLPSEVSDKNITFYGQKLCPKYTLCIYSR